MAEIYSILRSGDRFSTLENWTCEIHFSGFSKNRTVAQTKYRGYLNLRYSYFQQLAILRAFSQPFSRVPSNTIVSNFIRANTIRAKFEARPTQIRIFPRFRFDPHRTRARTCKIENRVVGTRIRERRRYHLFRFDYRKKRSFIQYFPFFFFSLLSHTHSARYYRL